jgi:hypothetical protein
MIVDTRRPVQRRTYVSDVDRRRQGRARGVGQAHALWLAAGLALAFALPFVFADLLSIQRDAYYGLYAVAVGVFLASWARLTHQDVRASLTRHWRLTAALAIACGGMLVVVVLGEPATSRPSGWSFAGALLWRGVVYGAVDGLLLSSFPILATFAAFSATPLRERSRRTVAGIGALALAVSIAFTAVYHLGYPDFRGSKVRKPVTGSVIWSAPTLLTLNPLGAPAAHIALHLAAVTHSYQTTTFLPPHR